MTSGGDPSAQVRSALWDVHACTEAAQALCRRLVGRFLTPFQWPFSHWALCRHVPTPPPPPPTSPRRAQAAATPKAAEAGFSKGQPAVPARFLHLPSGPLKAVRSFQEVRRALQEPRGPPTVLVLDIDYTVLVSMGTRLFCAPPACHSALMDAMQEASIVVFITGRPGPLQGCDRNVEATLRELKGVNIEASAQHVVFVGHVHKGPTVAAWVHKHVPLGHRVCFVDDNLDCIASVAEAAPHVQPFWFVGELDTPAAEVLRDGRSHLCKPYDAAK